MSTLTITQQQAKVGSPSKLLPKKEDYHFNTYASSQTFARETFQLVRELIYTLLAQEHGVHLNGHTNGIVPPNFKNQDLNYTYQSLLAACRQFLKQHRLELQNRVNSLDISDSFLYTSYHQVLNKMFEEQVVNWGRVIAMFCFTEALAFRVHAELMSPCAIIESLIGWQANFVIESLQGWIIDQQGGWVSHAF